MLFTLILFNHPFILVCVSNGWSYTMVIFNLSATFLFLIRTCPQMLLNVVVLGRETSYFYFQNDAGHCHLFVLTVFFFQCYFFSL